MSDKWDTDLELDPRTVSWKLEEHGALIMLEELCDEAEEANISQNTNTTEIENRERIKTVQGICDQEIYVEGKNEPHSPQSPDVIVLPDQENAEKNTNFNLVFPNGHDFVVEGERALAVIVAKENADSDESDQYKDYNKCLSRVNKEQLPRSVRASVRGRGLKRRVQASPSLTVTSRSQSNNERDQDDIPHTSLHNTIAYITRSPESLPKLVIKKLQKINEFQNIMCTDNSCRSNYDNINHCNVVRMNTFPVAHSCQSYNKIYQNNDVQATFQQNIVTDIMRKHESRPRLTIKKPDQINNQTTEKTVPINHNYSGNSDKIKDRNVNRIIVSPMTQFRQSKWDEVSVRQDKISTPQHNIFGDTRGSPESGPSLIVKKPEQINGPILERIVQKDHSYCNTSETNQDRNIDNVNISSIPPSSQRNENMNQVSTSDIPTTPQRNHKSRRRELLLSSPRQPVKDPELINEPTLEKIMQTDRNYFDANATSISNYRNISIEPSNQINKNGDQLRACENVPITPPRTTDADMTRNFESRLKRIVEKPDQQNESTPDKNIRKDGDADMTRHYESGRKRMVEKVDQQNDSTPDKIIRKGSDAEKIYCYTKNTESFALLSCHNNNRVCTSDDDLLDTVKENVSSSITKTHDAESRLASNELNEINEPSPEKRTRADRKDCNSDESKMFNVDNTESSLTRHSSNNSKKKHQHINGDKKRKSRSRRVVKNPKRVNATETEKIKQIYNNNVYRPSDTTKDCHVDLTNTSPTPHLSETSDKDVTNAVQHIISNIKKTHKSRPSLAVKKSKHINKSNSKTTMQVYNYVDEDKAVSDGFDTMYEMFLLSGKDHLKWSSMESFQGVRESLKTTKIGSVASHDTIYDAFRSFWDDEILNTIVMETNRHANSSSTSELFKKQWYDTNIHEILVLFSFWMMLGVIRLPTIKSCFSNDPLLKVNVFRTMFTKNRYESLVNVLSFANVDDTEMANASALHGVSAILDYLNTKFQSNFIPDQNVRVDESVLTPFQQAYSKNITVYSEIKTLDLYDNATGYLWYLLLNTEQDERDVLKLLRPLLNKGYTVYMNHSLNSPTLAKFLKENKTDCVGKLALSSEGFLAIEGFANMKPGQVLAQHAKNVCVTVWYSKNKMLYISTYHGIDIREIFNKDGERQRKGWKPQVVVDCDKNLDVAGRENQMLEPYVMERNRCDGCHMKFFKRLLNCSVLNAQILLESSKKKKVDHLAARLQLNDSILDKHLSLCPVSKRHSRQTLNLPPWRANRSEKGHWPALCEIETADSNRLNLFPCVYCLSRGLCNNTTIYKCEQCDVPLCVLCFKGFHSQSM